MVILKVTKKLKNKELHIAPLIYPVKANALLRLSDSDFNDVTVQTAIKQGLLSIEEEIKESVSEEKVLLTNKTTRTLVLDELSFAPSQSITILKSRLNHPHMQLAIKKDWITITSVKKESIKDVSARKESIKKKITKKKTAKKTTKKKSSKEELEIEDDHKTKTGAWNPYKKKIMDIKETSKSPRNLSTPNQKNSEVQTGDVDFGDDEVQKAKPKTRKKTTKKKASAKKATKKPVKKKSVKIKKTLRPVGERRKEATAIEAEAELDPAFLNNRETR